MKRDAHAATTEFMQEMAAAVDQALNGTTRPKPTGFVLLVFPFNGPAGARVNYVSNGERRDVLVAMKEVIARWEGNYAEPKSKN
jgi:hypothetical protein